MNGGENCINEAVSLGTKTESSRKRGCNRSHADRDGNENGNEKNETRPENWPDE